MNKLRRKIFIGTAGFTVIIVIITAIFTNKIAGTQIQQALTNSAKSHITYHHVWRSEELEELTAEMTKSTILMALVVLFFAGIAGFLFLGRIVVAPISHLQAVVTKVANGDFTARANIQTGDELETLSNTFNGLLEERITGLLKAEKENEQLNNSIIELLSVSFKPRQRDLTVSVPVTEDVTGAIADAINQLATETSKVSLNVRHIADEVEAASRQVKLQGEKMSNLAEAKLEAVDSITAELAAAAEAWNTIAEVAQLCNELADYATHTTETALVTITSIVETTSEIRQTIYETKKRIKHLGEGAQEILKGFSVVDEELQRIVGSSGDMHTTALVKNLQLETNEIIMIMNTLIGQIVAQIAKASKQQAQISNELREQAGTIQKSSQEMGKQLKEQMIQIDSLVEFSQQLITSVRIFKLPET